MKKIIISEEQEKIIINETRKINKVSIVKNFLDKNFRRDKTEGRQDTDGFVKNKEVVAWVDIYNQPIKIMNAVQLFYVLQEKFKNIYSDPQERDTFLKRIIKSWYKRKISKFDSIID